MVIKKLVLKTPHIPKIKTFIPQRIHKWRNIILNTRPTLSTTITIIIINIFIIIKGKIYEN